MSCDTQSWAGMIITLIFAGLVGTMLWKLMDLVKDAFKED